MQQADRGAGRHGLGAIVAALLLVTGCADGCGGVAPAGRGELPLVGIPRGAPDGPFRREGAGGVVLLEGRMAGGEPVGEWVARHPGGGEKARGRFDEEGRPTGEWVTRWPGGAVQERGRYEEGEAEGTWRLYWPSGALFEELELRGGEAHGPWRMYYEDGALADVMRFEGGLQVGVETDHAPDGTVLAEGSFRAGVPVGTWTCWEGGVPRAIPAPRSRDVTPRQACGHPALRELDVD